MLTGCDVSEYTVPGFVKFVKQNHTGIPDFDFLMLPQNSGCPTQKKLMKKLSI